MGRGGVWTDAGAPRCAWRRRTESGHAPPVQIAPTGSGLLTGIRRRPYRTRISRAAQPSRLKEGSSRQGDFHLSVLGRRCRLQRQPGWDTKCSDKAAGSYWLRRVCARMLNPGPTYTPFTYSGNYGHYLNSAANDFNEHAFVATSSTSSPHAPICRRQRFTSSSRILSVRSTARSTDSVQLARGEARLRRSDTGHPSAEGRLELDLGATRQTIYQPSARLPRPDVSTWNVAGRFFYRITPRYGCWPRSAIPSTITVPRR
jgi:hypothetical protein